VCVSVCVYVSVCVSVCVNERAQLTVETVVILCFAPSITSIFLVAKWDTDDSCSRGCAM
jgi:hypothetical protein